MMNSNKVFKTLLFLGLAIISVAWVWFLAISRKYNGNFAQDPQVLQVSPFLLVIGGLIALVSFVVSISDRALRSKGYPIVIALMLTLCYGVSYFLLYTLLTKYVK